MDEFEKLYNEIFGFEFSYGSGHLSKSKPVSWYRVKLTPLEKNNGGDVPMFVRCRKCGEYMNFKEGWYECEKDKVRVKEKTLYSQLGRENQEFDKEYEEIWNC